jgi:hypothetical protein
VPSRRSRSVGPAGDRSRRTGSRSTGPRRPSHPTRGRYGPPERRLEGALPLREVERQHLQRDVLPAPPQVPEFAEQAPPRSPEPPAGVLRGRVETGRPDRLLQEVEVLPVERARRGTPSTTSSPYAPSPTRARFLRCRPSSRLPPSMSTSASIPGRRPRRGRSRRSQRARRLSSPRAEAAQRALRSIGVE